MFLGENTVIHIFAVIFVFFFVPGRIIDTVNDIRRR